MRRMSVSAFSLVLAAGLVLSVAVPAGAVDGNIQISPGSGLFDREFVYVNVLIECPSGTEAVDNLVEVRQTHDGVEAISQGSAEDVVCDGAGHVYQVRTRIIDRSMRFRPGPAEAEAWVLVCEDGASAEGSNGGNCTLHSDSETIIIYQRKSPGL